MAKRTNKNPPWDDVRVYDDDPAGVTFEIVFGDYVSELYGVADGETVEQAAMSVCRRFGWIDNPPGADEDETPGDDEEAEHGFDPIRDGWVGKDGLP